MNPSDSEASLLARLHKLPVAEREEFLRRACAADSALASRLTVDVHVSSLDSTETVSTGMSRPAQGAVWALEAALSVTDQENSGARIGVYKLLQKIGEGGFGVVWMAEQQEPMKRRVALKIIKVGMDTEDVIARFEAERQALARMEHTNIAHVYE